MKIIDTPILDLKVIEPQVFGDERGFFMESWKQSSFTDAGISVDFVQDNHSKSEKGVLRGLHFQTHKPQTKLVRVVVGSVYNVVVDCRLGSETYGEWYGIVLSAKNTKQLLIPKGFANGFLVLEDNTEYLYKVDDYRDKGGEGGLMRNDPEIGIEWDAVMKEFDIQDVQLSEKDRDYQALRDLPEYFIYKEKRYIKNFDKRNSEKKVLDRSVPSMKYPKKREVWYVKMGVNIGYETDGKSGFFRPMVVVNKIGSQYFCVPLSTKQKDSKFYYKLSGEIQGKTGSILLSQGRVIDMKRFSDKIGWIEKGDYIEIKKTIQELYLK